MNRYDYSTLAGKFEEYLAAHQPFGEPDSLYAPIRYINELGGKRIRPVLLLMAYNLWHEDITPALPAAMAIEYFHNFSLMHDDIMDEAPVRRGKQSVHALFGQNKAILSGDAMLIRCFDLLLESGKLNGSGAELASMMCRVSLEICEGQQLDMDFEQMESPTESAYLEMIRKKTSALLGGSLKLGAILGGASPSDQDLLYRFGEMIGLGFQIQDDWLDVFGETGLTGKQKGGDILRGKKNYLYVYTYNTLNPQERKHFVGLYEEASRDQDIRSVLEYYTKHNTGAHTQQKVFDYAEKGQSALDALGARDVVSLRELVGMLAMREG